MSNSTINQTSDQLQPTVFCRRFQEEEYQTVNFIATLAFIILNLVSCPVIIVMNVLVILVVKTRHRLQSMYNILLACLAGTDLLVGAITQPALIAAEIFVITGGSTPTYCIIKHRITNKLKSFSILASLLHLVLISAERFIAMKYALQYQELVTRSRLAIAVALCWLLSGLVSFIRIIRVYPLDVISLRGLLICSLLAIFYSHIVVYLITRRHQKQIRAEQIAGEVAAKFLKEKKAWKTTSIIIGFLFLSFLPVLIYNFVLRSLPTKALFIIPHFIEFSLILNSLCNPIIYCWRSKKIRKAIIALVKGQNQN